MKEGSGWRRHLIEETIEEIVLDNVELRWRRYLENI